MFIADVNLDSRVHWFDSAEKFLESRIEADAIIVDIHLNGISGIECIQTLSKSFRVPVFALSSDRSPSVRIEALSRGISDFLFKDMSSEEIRLRIRNGMKMFRADSKNLKCGNLELNYRRLSAFIESEEIPLSRTEFLLLTVMIENQPGPVLRQSIEDVVWSGRQVDSGNLHSQVYNLNRKLKNWSYHIKAQRFVGLELVEKAEFTNAPEQARL